MASEAAQKEIYRGEFGELIDTFPWLEYKFAGVEAWLWIVIPALFFASYIVARFLVSAVLFIADKLNVVEHRLMKRYFFSIAQPLAFLLTGIIFNAAQGLLPISALAEVKLSYFNSLIYTVSFSWILIVYTSKALESARQRLQRQGRHASSSLIPLLRKMATAAIIIFALLFLLQNIGFDVAALIAALGIGGIAVALASQKSVENLLGGIMIALDQPVRVGDLGRFGDRIGTVEDIGLRSTQIRTLDRTILSIPNADMASMRVENIIARDLIPLNQIIGLKYETTTDQARAIVIAVKEMLASHPMVSAQQIRFSFTDYGAAALNFNLDIFIKTVSKDKFLEVQEDVLLKIREIILNEGSDVNAPASTVYIAHADIVQDSMPAKR